MLRLTLGAILVASLYASSTISSEQYADPSAPPAAGESGWRQTLSQDQPTVRALQEDPANPARIYAAGVISPAPYFYGLPALFVSDDRGVSWRTQRLPVPQFSGLETLALDPRDSRTLYASDFQYGTYKSVDGGATWMSRDVGLPDAARNASSIAVDPTAPQVLYQANGDGVYRSADGAMTWHRLGIVTEPCGWNSVAVAPSDHTRVYAAGGCGLFESRDAGASWQGVPHAPRGGALALAVDPRDPDTIYVAVEAVGVLRGTGDGAVWRLLDAGTCADAVAVDPRHPERVAAAGSCPLRPDSTGVRWSPDRGHTWVSLGDPDPGTPFHHALLFDGDTLLVGSRGVWLHDLPPLGAPTPAFPRTGGGGQAGHARS